MKVATVTAEDLWVEIDGRDMYSVVIQGIHAWMRGIGTNKPMAILSLTYDEDTPTTDLISIGMDLVEIALEETVRNHAAEWVIHQKATYVDAGLEMSAMVYVTDVVL